VSPTREVHPQARFALAVLVLVYAVNFIDRKLLVMLLQPIKEEFGASDFAMGILVGPAFALFYTFAGIPIARLADRGSRRRVMAIGIAFWSAMTAVSGLVQGYWQLALARIGVGVGEASATPAAHSMISDLYPPERRTGAIAIYNAGASLGVLAGLILAGVLQDAFGWRTAFFVVGLPGLAVAAFVGIALPEPSRGGADAQNDAGSVHAMGETLLTLVRIPTLRHITLAAGLYSISMYGVLNWSATFMRRVHGLSYSEIGFQLGLTMGIAGALGIVASGKLCDRLAGRDPRWLCWVPALAGVLLVPFHALFVWSDDPRVAVLFAFTGLNLLVAVFSAPTYSLAQNLAPLRMRATAAAGVLFMLNLIGLGIGPLLVGGLNDFLEARYGDSAVRLSLTGILVFNFWAAGHSLWASRSLRGDLERTQAPS
jgi:predicted MFS family arabinose efflux permease